MQAIRRMMGADIGRIDPFPIGKTRNTIARPEDFDAPTQPRRPQR
jgi:hypothetical protein